MHCPSCGAKSPDTAAAGRFCMSCGQPLPERLPARALRVVVDARPSFAVATVHLEAGQQIRAEAGAMVGMSAHVQLEGAMQGGLLDALQRAAARESFFQTTFTAVGAPGEVMLAPPAPGDIVVVELGGRSFFVQAASFLACEPSVQLETRFAGHKGFFSGEGLFFLRAVGAGTLLVSSFGAVVTKTLRPGERYVVDTGHVVAFESSVRYQLRKASAKGWWSSMKSGEGVVAEYEGPGEVLLQTRNLAALALQLHPFLPRAPQVGAVDFGRSGA